MVAYPPSLGGDPDAPCNVLQGTDFPVQAEC